MFLMSFLVAQGTNTVIASFFGLLTQLFKTSAFENSKKTQLELLMIKRALN
jgi:hypothetical protein